ncbi:hypothetical protein [Leptolyngbya sp. FACHB-17]|uniref:hypothetical protein n=1 Tax=Leptolyngbya sp. FACHB-17 TaxID=2692803 RepID=UPI00167FFAA4|nr:hypothetical protein [Leptolyngbya sp. FACHB-17]MBD2082383.1 hypothetical protein [Leptolyngbya sp. FACHB-17]
MLDEKLDAALEGKKLFLVLIEESPQLQSNDTQNLEPRKQRFLEQLQQYSFKLPEDYEFDRAELYER